MIQNAVTPKLILIFGRNCHQIAIICCKVQNYNSIPVRCKGVHLVKLLINFHLHSVSRGQRERELPLYLLHITKHFNFLFQSPSDLCLITMVHIGSCFILSQYRVTLVYIQACPLPCYEPEGHGFET
jgi:hypothetical protein